MPSFERKNPFSSRREGPPKAVDVKMERTRNEAIAKDFKESLSDTPPWERPGYVEEMQALSANDTPIPRSSVYSKKPKQVESPADPEQQERPSLRAITLNKKIQNLYQSEKTVSAPEADDRYGEDLHNIELIIQGLLTRPDDADLMETLREMERRYR